MLGPDGGPQPAWQPFLKALDELGPEEVSRRWQDARQLIRENGVTYNVYGDPRGRDRPVALDPIPFLLSAADQDALQVGLVQRARLLELILADLYGPQLLLREGLLPPELVFAHPGFLRPCHGIRPPAGRYLHLHAVNLGRSADGQFHVLGDRTGAPSGAGYALENRLVLARMLPDVFRDCQVQRLAQFFLAWRDTLREIAPHHRDNPRIVLLTPGPYNETYFEHAYLSQYLGFTLVEGGDLTVRGDRLFLKLLGRLQPVDVVLRRMDDDYCDPLELRRDSFLGVPGLVQAVRAGNVVVANSLGSGLIETPALLAFLPAVCRHLLGEPLHTPSVPTWWCGEARAREHVLANLHRLVIKPAFPSLAEPVFGERLSSEQLQVLAERIRARPGEFVGQEQLVLSTTPVLVSGRLEPRRFVFRTFLAASKDSYTVMPGGLTRVAATAEAVSVSMQQGGGTKDTWVLSRGPVSTVSLLPPATRPVALSRGGTDLPSRTADNLYWLGRYVERAEGCVRLLRGILIRLTEKTGLADAPELPVLLRALTHQGMTYPGFAGAGGEEHLAHPEKELLSVAFDDSRPGSLQWTLSLLQRVSWSVRARTSSDTWRTLSRISLPPHREGTTLSDLLEHLEGLVIYLTAFAGLATENMTRGQSWQFLDMGRRLERSLHTIGLLQSTLVRPGGSVPTPERGNEGPLLEAVLEVADSSMTYRSRYLNNLQAGPVLDLLLADETNPRSLVFQLVALNGVVEQLPRETPAPTRQPETRIMMAALTDLRLADIEELALVNEAGVRANLDSLLTRLGKQLSLFSDKITQHYLTHIQATRQLSAL
jgi:uncharacterized circularly permuted ATP-grasp superfamily protein/uncharacterized alpha-E superfamily protein